MPDKNERSFEYTKNERGLMFICLLSQVGVSIYLGHVGTAALPVSQAGLYTCGALVVGLSIFMWRMTYR